MPASNLQTVRADTSRKPREDEIDVHGLTHRGKVREDNQDHYLLCSLRRQLVVRGPASPTPRVCWPRASGSRRWRWWPTAWVARRVERPRAASPSPPSPSTSPAACAAITREEDEQFYQALKEGAEQSHEELLRRGKEDTEYSGMATTLTLYLGVWPRAYLLQVGDSRCYVLRDGKLVQITRDQTMGQEMVDHGLLKPEQVAGTRLEHTLTSAIGGHQNAPVVSRFDMTWGHVLLLCSDGLTGHVSDDRIGEVLRSMTSAQQACETLLRDALDGGGKDNITIVVGRAMPSEPARR